MEFRYWSGRRVGSSVLCWAYGTARVSEYNTANYVDCTLCFGNNVRMSKREDVHCQHFGLVLSLTYNVDTISAVFESVT